MPSVGGTKSYSASASNSSIQARSRFFISDPVVIRQTFEGNPEHNNARSFRMIVHHGPFRCWQVQTSGVYDHRRKMSTNNLESCLHRSSCPADMVFNALRRRGNPNIIIRRDRSSTAPDKPSSRKSFARIELAVRNLFPPIVPVQLRLSCDSGSVDPRQHRLLDNHFIVFSSLPGSKIRWLQLLVLSFLRQRNPPVFQNGMSSPSSQSIGSLPFPFGH